MHDGVPQHRHSLTRALRDHFLSRADREWLGGIAEEALADADEGNDQQQLQRRHREVRGLDRGQVQTPQERHGRAQHGRRAEHWEDTQDRAAREAQADSLGRDALPEQRDDRDDDVPAHERDHA